MTEVATAECDGCAEKHPVQQLEPVTLPTGETVTCCPDCRYHAEQLAGGATATCEGCGETVDATDLDPTPVPDGRTLRLCPECVDEAASVHESANASGADATAGSTAGSSVSGATADGGQPGGAHQSTTGGTGAGSDATGSDAGAAEPNAGATGEPDAGATGEPDAGTTGKPARTEDVCDQCGGLFSIELFQVKTVDGRTEQFCPDCKEDGVREGIVRDVELRRAQAYEVLELPGSASQEEIREAYLRRVKEVHPDRADGNRSEFMLVKEAYERLGED